MIAASAQDDLPASTRPYGCEHDVGHLLSVDPLVAERLGAEDLSRQVAPGRSISMLQDPGVELARVGESLTLVEGNVEKPLLPSRLRQAGGATPAVVEDVCDLMNDEVRRWT